MFINEHDEVDPEFATAMVKLAAAYGTQLTTLRIQMYARGLGDFTLAQVRSAFGRAIREASFFPQVAELRRYVEPSADDAALLAWAGLAQAAADIGAYASLAVEDHSAAEALIQTFGSWSAYCAADGPMVGARKAEFVAAYRDARRRVRHEGAVTLLPGLCDAPREAATALPDGITWRGRLTARGTVVQERDQQRQLGAGSQINRLIGGDDGGASTKADNG